MLELEPSLCSRRASAWKERELEVLPVAGADATLKEIAQIKTLGTLVLDDCNELTDIGLQELCTLQDLRSISVRSCRGITGAGVKEFQDKLPDVDVRR
jgi:hypothetical protein